MTIKAAVFDLGGVVIEFHPVELTQKFGKDDKEAKLYLDVLSHPDWLEYDRGVYTTDEMAERIYQRTGSSIERSKEFFQYLRNSFDAIKPTWKFIDALKKENIDIYLLSNMNVDTFNHLKETFVIFKAFKGGVISEKVGYCKPEPEIFEVFLKQTGLKTNEFFFLDDTLVNVEQAKKMNWNVYQYNKYNCYDVQKEIWEIIKKNK